MNLLFYTPVQIAFLVALLVGVSIAFGYYAAKNAYGESAMNEKNKNLYTKVNEYGLKIASLNKKLEGRQREVDDLRNDFNEEAERCKLLERANEELEYEKVKHGVREWGKGYCTGKGIIFPEENKKQVSATADKQEQGKKKNNLGSSFIEDYIG